MVDLSLSARHTVQPGEFNVAAIGLDHGHIYGICSHLGEAGAKVVAVYDDDPRRVAAFRKLFPSARPVREIGEILEDPTVQMVAAAPVPDQRAALGLAVHNHGKHYFSAKPGFVSEEQIRQARQSAAATRLKWAVCYNERVENEAAVRAGHLIADGAVGRVVQVLGLGPHRLAPADRPDWFFDPRRNGGVLVDLGSHQMEQFLAFAGAESAEITHAATANYTQPGHPGFEDFGEVALTGGDDVRGYFRVDWLTPDGLGTFGDGRAIILGTDGYIEIRKNIDVAASGEDNVLLLVDQRGEHREVCRGTVGLPYFGTLIHDCLAGEEQAMPQEHVFTAAELAVRAQRCAGTPRSTRRR